MEKLLHRKILIISLTGLLITTAGVIACLLIDKSDLYILPALLFTLPLSSIMTIYAIKYSDKSWFRKTSKYSLFLIPVGTAGLVFCYFVDASNAVIITLIILMLVIATLSMIHLFVFAKATSLFGVIVILISLIFGIFLKRNHLLFAGMTLTIFSLLMSVGVFMFGIRCLFLSENLTYFRNTTFIGCCIISISYLGQMFKLQHWPAAGYLLQIGLASLIIGTLYILLTLHSSGFIDWKKFHKKILGKILIPWTFIFIMYISRFMVPELYTLIWYPDSFITKKTEQPYGFNMKDYIINNKDLIKPE